MDRSYHTLQAQVDPLDHHLMRVPERRFFGCCCFEYIDSRVPLHELGIFDLVLVSRLQRLLKPRVPMTSASFITKENFDRRVTAAHAKGAYDGPETQG